MVQLEEISLSEHQLVPIPSRRWRPFTERGEDPASIIFVGRNHEGRPTSLQDLVEIFCRNLRHGLRDLLEAEVVK